MIHEDLIESARRKIAQQGADLVNKARLSPLEVCNLYLEVGTAIALQVVAPKQVAGSFRQHADTIEAMAEDMALSDDEA